MTRRSKSKAFSKYQFECSTYEWNNSFVSTVIRYSRIGICILENFLLNLSNVQRLFFAKLFDFALTFLTILNPLFYNLKKHFIVFKYDVLPSLKWKKSILGANIQIHQNIKIKIFSAKGVIPFICWTFKLILSKGVISFICWTFKLILISNRF